jgi:sarcosine oxidase subunit alpha
MGPSQGKFEVINTIAVLGEAVGASIGDLGTTVWRPPFAPISLGALAGKHAEPVRISPMQEWHDAHGAEPLIAGQWIRPEHYGDPTAEVTAVRGGVGIIDVTPLGKLDLRGPDVPKLLNLVYVNSWNKLDIGSVRYGVMCAEDGVVMDDGVTGRLGENQYLMSTTSSGAATVWEWLENWLQTEHPDWQVHITPVTTSYASINIAGPKSRELMSRLVTDVDLSNEAFPYMKVRQGTIAGVANCVTRSTARPVTDSTFGGRCWRPELTSACSPSASRPSGCCDWRRAISSWPRTPTHSPRVSAPASTV